MHVFFHSDIFICVYTDISMCVRQTSPCVFIQIHVNACVFSFRYIHMGWLRLVGSLKLQVSFAKEPYKRVYILQRRLLISRSLLIVATPYVFIQIYLCVLDRRGQTSPCVFSAMRMNKHGESHLFLLIRIYPCVIIRIYLCV